MSWSEPLPPSPSLGPPGVPTDDLDVEPLVGERTPWWVVSLLGVLMVGLGVWLLANLVESVLVLALLIGVSLIAGGLVDALVLGHYRSRARWASWLEGLVLVGTGVVVLTWPDITLWVLTLTAGISLLLSGLVGIVVALYRRHSAPTWHLELGLGAFAATMGAFILLWPEATVVVLAVAFGIRTTVVGLVAIGTGWQRRREQQATARAAAA